MSAIVIFQQMCIIFLLIMTGYYLSKRGIISEAAERDLSALVVNVCNPAQIIYSVTDTQTSVTGRNVLISAVAWFIIYAVLIVLANVIPTLMRVDKKEHGQFGLLVLFNNTGFIGIPVVSAVLGTQYLIYIVVGGIFFNILAYTYGVYLISKGHGNQEIRLTPRRFFNVGSVAGVIAVFIFAFHLPLPEIIVEPISYAGRATTFISMLVIGMSLAKMPLKEIFGDRRMYGFCFLRYFGIAALIGIVLQQFGLDKMMCATITLTLAMPAANLPLMLAEERGIDGGLLSRAIVLSTVLSLVIIPLTALVL